ncbi:hypothetical protein HK104_007065, partial [Borealophlyctis nickersoniae]
MSTSLSTMRLAPPRYELPIAVRVQKEESGHPKQASTKEEEKAAAAPAPSQDHPSRKPQSRSHQPSQQSEEEAPQVQPQMEDKTFALQSSVHTKGPEPTMRVPLPAQPPRKSDFSPRSADVDVKSSPPITASPVTAPASSETANNAESRQFNKVVTNIKQTMNAPSRHPSKPARQQKSATSPISNVTETLPPQNGHVLPEKGVSLPEKPALSDQHENGRKRNPNKSPTKTIGSNVGSHGLMNLPARGFHLVERRPTNEKANKRVADTASAAEKVVETKERVGDAAAALQANSETGESIELVPAVVTKAKDGREKTSEIPEPFSIAVPASIDMGNKLNFFALPEQPLTMLAASEIFSSEMSKTEPRISEASMDDKPIVKSEKTPEPVPVASVEPTVEPTPAAAPTMAEVEQPAATTTVKADSAPTPAVTAVEPKPAAVEPTVEAEKLAAAVSAPRGLKELIYRETAQQIQPQPGIITTFNLSLSSISSTDSNHSTTPTADPDPFPPAIIFRTLPHSPTTVPDSHTTKLAPPVRSCTHLTDSKSAPSSKPQPTPSTKSHATASSASKSRPPFGDQLTNETDAEPAAPFHTLLT